MTGSTLRQLSFGTFVMEANNLYAAKVSGLSEWFERLSRHGSRAGKVEPRPLRVDMF